MSRHAAPTRTGTPNRGGATSGEVSLTTAVYFLSLLLVVVAVAQSQSSVALLVVLNDGVQAALVLAAATGAGLWLVVLLGQRTAPLRWQILLASGLGIGGLMLLVFGAGRLGLLHRWCWFMLLAAMLTAGSARIVQLIRAARSDADREPLRVLPIHWLWLLAMPALGLTLVAAAVMPGFLWIEEARGYDVLEYHLGGPKEYFLAGRIDDLPHNVYTYFPFNVEMLYLLAMVLKGGVIEASLLAKMLNAGLGVLAVAAIWLAGRTFSRNAGIAAGVVAATMPWLTYLSGVCFVENGMLFFGALSVACFCRAAADPERATGSLALVAGLLAGFSCGCKYTAVVMFAVPLVFAWVVPIPKTRYRRPVLFALGTLLTFSPWLVKNAVVTGNPVFPLAGSLFDADEELWPDAQQAQWDAAHRPSPDQDAVGARLGALWSRVLGESRFTRVPGVLFLLALLPLVARRTRIDVTLIGLLFVQLGVWTFATHLYARFAVPALVPVAILCGRNLSTLTARWSRGLVLAALSGLGVANLYASARLYYDHRGHETAATADSWVNAIMPDGAYVLLVGDARAFYVKPRVDYCVVFSRNPFADAITAAGDEPEAVLRWLQDKGYTHVAVLWPEIDRLRNSYGFWPEIDRDLFTRLEAAGLRVGRHIRQRDDAPPVATVYEVPAS